MAWLRESDIVIAEVTTPSLGVGYEIGRAIELGKRVVCMYRENNGKSVSAMIKGSTEIELFNYKGCPDAIEIIAKLFKSMEL